MKHELTYSGCESFERDATGKPEARRDRSSRTKWRAVLEVLVGAPMRLHNYRHLHAEVIEDALRAFDCGPRHGDQS
jgi:hypothetical protein